MAYDLDRGDWRTFRLDRLTAVPRPTGARFRARELPAADAAEFVQTGIDRVHSTHEVEVLIDAGAGEVREKIGRWASIEPAGENRCRVRMTSDSLDWPVFALGVVGADFEVVSPPELRALVADWGRRFTRAVK